MKQILRPLAFAAAAALAGFGMPVQAEQTIGIQPSGSSASATARVTVRVVVPKVILLRVGNADTTQATVTVTADVSPAVPLAPGNSLDGTGVADTPAFATTVATTDPAGAGALQMRAWTNDSTGAVLTCARAADGTNTAFAAGATTTSAPGTDDLTIAVAGTALALPGAGTSLTACNGVATTSISAFTAYNGTYTFGSSLTSGQIAALPPGTYGNLVTFTATAP